MPARFSHSLAPKRGNQPRIRLLIALLVASVLLMGISAATGQTGPLAAVRGVVQTIVMPVRYAGSVVFAPFDGFENIMGNLTASSESLSELKAENEQLKADNARLKEASLATERLEALLELKNTYNLQSTGARIVSGAVDAAANTVLIDKGTSSGIAVGMPVTDSYGVLGQVSEVGPSTAVVRLITDERSGVAAMVQKSRAQGQLKGQGTDELSLELVRTGQEVNVGDLVVTSGLGGVYPKGLLLGTVTNVERPQGALYLSITVKPAASVTNFEEVLVITSLTDEQKSSAEDSAEADYQQKTTAQSDTSQEGAEQTDDQAAEAASAEGSQAPADTDAQSSGQGGA